MKTNVPLVISKVVNNDLCVGCGACVDICPSNSLKMEWDDNGLLIPIQINPCCSEEKCIKVCPFNPNDEATIDDLFNKKNTDTDQLQYNKFIGNFTSLYAGYSNKYRLTSSAGGIATWVVDQLFKERLIDFAIGVASSNKTSSHFEYQIISQEDNLNLMSKTKYYPTTLEGIFNFIRQNEGNYVLTGLPCFLKAVRLFQNQDNTVKERIKYTIGIVCGGMKSRFFTEYLAWKLGILPDEIKDPNYRVKDNALTAGDYSFSFKENGKQREKKIRNIGHNWGYGLFKPNSCDFCDDIFAELSDISVGDAWMRPYDKDGRGTNIIIVRSLVIDSIIKKGVINNELTIEDETVKRINDSQKGNIRHRRKGLQFRLFVSNQKGLKILGKRVKQRRLMSPIFIIIQKLRMQLREKSFEAWKVQRNNFNKNTFEKGIDKVKKKLDYYTKGLDYFRLKKYVIKFRKIFKV